MTQKQPEELFLKCSCGSEVLNLELDPHDGMYCLAIYEFASTKLSWFQRLRYCWKTLKTGKPFNDNMMLHHTHIEKLQEYLKHSEEYRVEFTKSSQEVLVKSKTDTQKG